MSNTRKKIIIMCIVMIVTSASFVFSTLAYFTDSTATRYGNIATGTASVEIIDVTYPYGSDVAVPPGTAIRILPGYVISKTVTAKNTGDLPMYIRVKVNSDITLANTVQGREAEVDTSLVSYDINKEDWILHSDGYYYYNRALTRGTEADPLFTAVKFSEQMGNLYKDSTIKFTVRMEVVQANNNGANALEAQGWSSTLVEGGDSQ